MFPRFFPLAKTMPPSCWPTNVQYLSASRFHPDVPMEIRLLVESGSRNKDQADRKRHSLVVIRLITSASHPAHGQRGLFAARKIPPRTHILDYIGEIHCDDRDSDYDLSLYRAPDGVNVGIDAQSMGNEARFINDFRGVSNKSNAQFEDMKSPFGELRMSVWSGNEVIRKGQEILVSYGKSWWRARSSDPAPLH